MTISDFYLVTHNSDRVFIKDDSKVLYHGKIRDIPVEHFDLVIKHIGVDYTHFSFIVVII